MALTKIINDGDELLFDLHHVDPQARKQISIVLIKRARPANILVIRADRSIQIKHVRNGEQVKEVGSMGLPIYRCHKQVQAAKITKIAVNGNDDSICAVPTYTLTFGLIGQSIVVTEEWMNKFKAEEGGYYVVYEDGYASYSPAKPFETGYLPA